MSTPGGHAAAGRRVGDRPRALHGERRRHARSSGSRLRRRQASRSPQNNVRDALIEVRDRAEKVLYFEGEPRFEMKFIRRAVEDDKNLQARRPAAHGREQVLPVRHHHAGRAGGRLSEDARRAVRLSRNHPRQRRGRVVQRPSSCACSRDFVEQARRRSADARRAPSRSRRAAGAARRSATCCRSSSRTAPSSRRSSRSCRRGRRARARPSR